MRTLLTILLALAVLGAGLGWWLTRPAPLDPGFATGLTPDAEAGRLVFAAGGCASCHAAPEAEDRTVLAGGQAFASDFGTFYAPNISTDPEAGIGAWDLPTFARAVTQGVGPTGAHLYPAFPYVFYDAMTDQEVADLHAYMATLPADATPSRAHDVGFPFNIRRAVGLWKLLYDTGEPVLTGALSLEVERGRHLVEGAAHCGECHTPRTALGGSCKNCHEKFRGPET